MGLKSIRNIQNKIRIPSREQGKMRSTAVFVISSTLAALTGCAVQQQPVRSELVSPATPAAERGMALLSAGQAQQASEEINRALALTPSDANLHFLNGLAYRLLSREKGQAVSELEETGYRLALEFDSGHWLAAWHLGLLQIEQRQYAEARKSLARAARLRPRNADIQLALAGSAYLAGDAPVALMAAEKTLGLRPGDPEALRVAALSSAALGMESGAHTFSDQLRDIRPAEAEDVAERIEAWKNTLAQATPLAEPQVAPSPPPVAGLPPPIPALPFEQGPLALAWSDCSQSATSTTTSSWTSGSSGSSSNWGGGGGWGNSSNGDATERLPALPSPCKNIPLPRMAVVDATLIRTQEASGFSQGVNLLDGLKIVLSGGKGTTITRADGGNTRSTTVTRNINLPEAGITYSLNIFNAADTTTDVIARPSLLALDRTPATFFSGATVSVALTGQYGGSLSDKNVGVSLSVTPTFIDDNRLLLSVKGARSFIEPTQFDGFEQAMTSTNNTVATSVIMNFGETLILSGLRERESIRTRKGVPLLRDIPLLQYLFATHSDSDYAKHVLILLTPRKPSTFTETAQAAHAYLHSPGFQAESDDLSLEALNALRPRRPNLETIVAKVQLSRYKHEFHSGDLSRRRFAPSPSLQRVLQDLRRLIHF